MLDKKQIADAAWANDAMADEGYDIPDIMRTLDINADDLTYVAKQRALRMILMGRGDQAIAQMKRDAYERYARTVAVSFQDSMLQMQMATLWLDAFAAGVRAANRENTGT